MFKVDPTNCTAYVVIGKTLCVLDIFLRPRSDRFLLVRTELPHDFSGRAKDERTRRNFCAPSDERVGTDDRPRPDHRAIENDCAHSNQHFIIDGAGVDDRTMTHRHHLTDNCRELIREMNNRAVLNV